LLLTLAAGLRPSPLTSLLLLEVGVGVVTQETETLQAVAVLEVLEHPQGHQEAVHLLNPL
jgi:hypothetical protein